jgi:hypothetical protein
MYIFPFGEHQLKICLLAAYSSHLYGQSTSSDPNQYAKFNYKKPYTNLLKTGPCQRNLKIVVQQLNLRVRGESTAIGQIGSDR